MFTEIARYFVCKINVKQSEIQSYHLKSNINIIECLKPRYYIEKATNFLINLKDALILGLAQTLAIIPGTSRSGIVITAGLLSGFSRYDASKYSLLLSIPVIIAATSLETISLYNVSGVFVTKQMLLGSNYMEVGKVVVHVEGCEPIQEDNELWDGKPLF